MNKGLEIYTRVLQPAYKKVTKTAEMGFSAAKTSLISPYVG